MQVKWNSSDEEGEDEAEYQVVTGWSKFQYKLCFVF
jgi:hypothetical protein